MTPTSNQSSSSTNTFSEIFLQSFLFPLLHYSSCELGYHNPLTAFPCPYYWTSRSLARRSHPPRSKLISGCSSIHTWSSMNSKPLWFLPYSHPTVLHAFLTLLMLPLPGNALPPAICLTPLSSLRLCSGIVTPGNPPWHPLICCRTSAYSEHCL